MSFDKLFDGSDAHELCGACGGTGILVGSECWFCDGTNALQTVIDTTDVQAPATEQVPPLADCGEAGHDEGRCGNASCGRARARDAEAFLETPDVQDESGINTYYSRALVLECIGAALRSEQAPAGEWATIPASFNDWWNSGAVTSNNPFEPDSAAYWAWEGYQFALSTPQAVPSNDGNDYQRANPDAYVHVSVVRKIIIWRNSLQESLREIATAKNGTATDAQFARELQWMAADAVGLPRDEVGK